MDGKGGRRREGARQRWQGERSLWPQRTAGGERATGDAAAKAMLSLEEGRATGCGILFVAIVLGLLKPKIDD